MMTQNEFITHAVGVPWVRWRSDWQAADCFGLIVLYHREVLSIELGAVPQIDIATGFNAAQGWQECGADAGATCFMAFRDGAPTHCGILLTGDQVLHSEGAPDHPGSARITRLAVIQRIYGATHFYRRTPC